MYNTHIHVGWSQDILPLRKIKWILNGPKTMYKQWCNTMEKCYATAIRHVTLNKNGPNDPIACEISELTDLKFGKMRALVSREKELDRHIPAQHMTTWNTSWSNRIWSLASYTNSGRNNGALTTSQQNDLFTLTPLCNTLCREAIIRIIIYIRDTTTIHHPVILDKCVNLHPNCHLKILCGSTEAAWHWEDRFLLTLTSHQKTISFHMNKTQMITYHVCLLDIFN